MKLFVKSIALAILLFWGVANSAIAAPVTLSQLLAEADANNPSLLAAKSQIDVSSAKVDQVSSLPDPVLSIALSNYPIDNLSTDVTPMTGNEFRLAQMFPFPGKLDAKGKIAAQKSRWFASAYEDARLQIRRQVEDAWYRFLFQRRAIELTQHNLEILANFIKLTETRYEVGKGLQQNVLKAQLQRSKQLDMLLGLRQQEEATLAELNSLAGRGTDRPLEIDEQLTEVTSRYDLAQLQQLAERNRPMFSAFDALIEQFKEQRELAKLDYKPDFTLWGSYRWRDNDLPDKGTDFISAGISFNLPVRLARREAAVAEADSSLRMAYQKRDDFRNKVDLTIHQALTRFKQAGELVELYQGGIIPQAEQTYQATMSAYEVDKVDFLNLLDAAMSLYRYDIDFARALSDQQRSRSQLEAAAGINSPAPSQGLAN